MRHIIIYGDEIDTKKFLKYVGIFIVISIIISTMPVNADEDQIELSCMQSQTIQSSQRTIQITLDETNKCLIRSYDGNDNNMDVINGKEKEELEPVYQYHIEVDINGMDGLDVYECEMDDHPDGLERPPFWQRKSFRYLTAIRDDNYRLIGVKFNCWYYFQPEPHTALWDGEACLEFVTGDEHCQPDWQWESTWWSNNQYSRWIGFSIGFEWPENLNWFSLFAVYTEDGQFIRNIDRTIYDWNPNSYI